MSEASMELIKGAKKSAIAEELDTPQVEEQQIDIEKMTVAQLDALVKENDLEVPDEWSKMNKGAKIAYLQEKYGDSESGEAAEAGDDATAAVETTQEEAKETAKAEAKKATKGKAVAKSTAKEGEVLGPDDITSAVKEIENLKEDAAKKMVKELDERIAFDGFKLGGVLSVISAQQWFSPYATFKEYVETEIGMKYRRAAYWIKIYNKIIDNGIEWAKVKHIGWTKLKELVDVLTPDNTDHWVKIASENTTLNLIELVKSALANEQKKLAGSEEGDEKAKVTTTMTFKVHEEQRKTIELAIDKAKQDGQTDVASVAIEYICADYIAGNAKPVWQRLKDMGIDDAVKALDKAFPDFNFAVEGKAETE